jgi:exopolysaccharide production protein ExoQ
MTRAGSARAKPGQGGGTFAAIVAWALLAYMTVSPELLIFNNDSSDPYASNWASRGLKLVFLLFGVALCLSRFGPFKNLLIRTNRFFVFFLILAPLSYLWSISPSDTLARYVTVLSVATVCMAFCLYGWQRERFQSILRSYLAVMLVGSLLFGLLSPDVGIEHGQGTLKDAWRGLTVQKNQFGQLAGFGVVFWLHGWLAHEVKAWKMLIFGGAAVTCVVLSHSSASLLSATFSAIFLVMLMRSPPQLRRYMPYIVGAFAGLVLVYALAVLRLVPGLDIVLRPITLLTGKDATFSNRSVIWEIIEEHIRENPFFGTGYGAYWIGPVPASPSFSFLSRMGFYPFESHNGYLEIINDLGTIGLLCLFGYIITFVHSSVRLMRTDRYQGALFLGLFFFQAVMNLSESSWLTVNSAFIFTIMTFATFALAQGAVQPRAQPAPARPTARSALRRRPMIR